ncbi:PRC-barrel domain-containing protein [Sinorhizobium fredii]|uniref:PRC-barrel domain containing protein n=2 Tax=Rhizobium fredii TaxID=380 RepID=A0A2A6LVC4_RHIFR|nr:PRC-barrel domain-containing protein [Sinorhizobium fredii]ASY67897.1 putative transmembrane signal peptide protein [Sinorhizobium fredii CCBAU 83666]AWM23826.1 putative transmembrane signal peptide protein [Sinorhizobium fredii CCBAU 25509]MQW94410.1 PRC-barrel domain containing protein [Sinorhizobium fredii]MQX10618.1 PRC-barrel domain containing protein [Sinorhizobium fredii]PDT46318.1 photosystem reaction center subunit H [Sinorhizobium fredii]
MTDKFISSVAAGALLVGVAIAPMSFAQETTTPPAAPAPETQTMEPAAPAAPAPADQAQTPAPADKTMDTAAAEGSYLTEQAEDQISANTYIGQSVYNANDESIGEINDLLIKKEGGVAAAVVGVGGFLGIGEKNVAVPFESIEVTEQPDSDALKLTTTETADSLKGAPEFKTKSQLMAERNAAQPVDTSTTSATGTTPAPAPVEPAPQQ